ncbi:hypothetical protein ACB092_10G003600, partial [Castanea dentata]
MDGLEEAKGILVLAATNRPHTIDAALMHPGHFDLVLYVPLPDLDGRYEILCVHTRNMKIGPDVDLRRIAEDTQLFTGAELEGLCREARIVALREDITATVVCDWHFQIVKGSLKPALIRAEIDSYASFMKNPSVKRTGEFVSSVKNDSKHKKESLGPLSTLKVGVVSVILLAAA